MQVFQIILVMALERNTFPRFLCSCLLLLAITWLPSGATLMAPTNEKRTEANWIGNDAFVPNEGWVTSQQAVQSSSGRGKQCANKVSTQGSRVGMRSSQAPDPQQPGPNSSRKLWLSFCQHYSTQHVWISLCLYLSLHLVEEVVLGVFELLHEQFMSNFILSIFK